MEERLFTCDSEGMAAAQGFLESVCDEPKPAVIMDEIVSNIVRCSGADSFTLRLNRGADGLEMEFSDAGRSFDPTRDVAAPDVNAPIEGRGVGGLGIFMVKKMAKSIAYRRADGRNVLTIRI